MKIDPSILEKEIEELKRQQQMLDIALSGASIMIRVVDKNGVIQYNNASKKNLFGYPEEDGIGQSTFLKIHPDDREHIGKLFHYSLIQPFSQESFPAEFRLRHQQGYYLWVHSEMKFITTPENTLRGIVAVWDITEEKMMRDAYHALAKRLNAAREDERAHIALRIHDEFGQSIAGLKFELSHLNKNIPTDQQKALTMTEEIMGSIDNMTELIERISTEFGPAVLDENGLRKRFNGLTCDIQEKTGLVIRFRSTSGELKSINGDDTIEIFRICQEALTNVARHASATEVMVHFQQDRNALSITIEDNGRGITESEVAGRMSLGLRSMRQRAATLGGKIKIEGRPGSGTRICFEMPLL